MEAHMQDAHVGNWNREPQVSAEMLESLRELNHRFLDLIATPTRDWNSTGRVGLNVDLWDQVAPLSAAQKRAVANCPYALFDLRFHDDQYWQTRAHSTRQWSVLDAAEVDSGTLDFVRLALFFAWHAASTSKLAARFLLGMNELTVAAFRAMTIDCLSALAATEAPHLTARWSDRPNYWKALMSAAGRPNPANLRRIQLSGLQLAAAVHLT
jgi:hypothetical protein